MDVWADQPVTSYRVGIDYPVDEKGFVSGPKIQTKVYITHFCYNFFCVLIIVNGGITNV